VNVRLSHSRLKTWKYTFFLNTTFYLNVILLVNFCWKQKSNKQLQPRRQLLYNFYDPNHRYIRRMLLKTGCDVGVPSAIMFAKNKFKEWMEHGIR